MADKRLLEKLKGIEAEVVLKMKPNQLVKYFVDDLKLFQREQDFKLFILEYLGKALLEDDVDWPIRYYEEQEEIDPDVDDSELEEMLTDDYVEQMKLKGLSPEPRQEH